MIVNYHSIWQAIMSLEIQDVNKRETMTVTKNMIDRYWKLQKQKSKVINQKAISYEQKITNKW